MDHEKDSLQSAEEARKPLSDGKKSALLRYLAIMFAVAFILVLLSWIIQSRNTQNQLSRVTESNSNALANAEKLQNENRNLQQEKADLEKRLQELQKEQEALETALRENEQALLQQLGELEELEDQQIQQLQALKASEDLLKKTVAAYDALAAALGSHSGAEVDGGYAAAMETLKNENQYLSDGARQIYLALLQG